MEKKFRIQFIETIYNKSSEIHEVDYLPIPGDYIDARGQFSEGRVFLVTKRIYRLEENLHQIYGSEVFPPFTPIDPNNLGVY
jgi:hypothetical protein